MDELGASQGAVDLIYWHDSGIFKRDYLLLPFYAHNQVDYHHVSGQAATCNSVTHFLFIVIRF